jgi:hypothetical protein
MSEIKHVDIGRSGSGYAGTEADPYSWLDVRARLVAVEAAAFDTGSIFDSNAAFDGAAINIDFLLRGVGELMTVENQISLSNFNCAPGSRIAFSAANPAKYGLPVIKSPNAYGVGVTAPSPTGALLRFSQATRLNLRMTGVIIAPELLLASNGWRFIDVINPVNSTLIFKNNVVVDNGYGNRLVSFVGADATCSVCAAHNTVIYGSNSVASHEFVRVEGCRLYSGRNIAVQSPDSSAVVSWSTATTSMYAGGSAYGLLSSSVIYNGVSPQMYEPDVLGLEQITQVLWNPSQMDSSRENPFDYVGTTGCSIPRTSSFWPVHCGGALGLGTATISPSISIELLDTDALGRDRMPGYSDAGAFQKTRLQNKVEVHVDLSTSGISNAHGTEESPITRDDFLIDWTRRAPVDNVTEYVLRNRNDNAPLAEFDMGPLSPNSAALDRRYGGAGEITLRGWKTSRRKLPILSARKIRPNANVNVVARSLKIEFANGGSANFIEPTVMSSALFVIANSVVRSRATCAGRITAYGSGHAKTWFTGSSIYVQHTAGISSGALSAGTLDFNLELCAVVLPNTTVLGVGGSNVNVKCCLVSTGAAGLATWAGATIDGLSRLNAAQPFVDPANVDYDLADFTLLDGSEAIGIAPFATSLTPILRDHVAYDARNLRRSAFPLGNEGSDAGAFERDFYIPPVKDYYLDLSKTRSGTGKAGDRWSPSDFAAWAASVETLDRRVVVHAIRRGILSLNLPDIEADANGAIEVKAEQPNDPAVWFVNGYDGLRGATSVPFYVNGMLVGVDGAARFARLPSAKLVISNSIIDKKHGAKQFTIVVSTGVPTGDDTLQITAGLNTIALQPNTNWTVASTAEGSAIALAEAIVAAGYEAKVDGVRVDVLGADDMSLGASPAILSVAPVSTLIDGDADIIGSSVAEEFESDLGLETTLVSGKARVSHSAFQGHQLSGTTRTRYGVNATGSVQRTGFHGCTTNVAGGASASGNVTAPVHLFSAEHSANRELSEFELNGSALVGLADSGTLPAWAAGSSIDIRGNLRFNALVTSTGDVDAGAIEQVFIDASSEYSAEASDPSIFITEEGLQLNTRALAGNVSFKLVGFVVGRGGYNFWDPTKTRAPIAQAKPGTAKFLIGSGAWSNETLTLVTPAGNVALAYGVHFEVGATAADTAENIAEALRANSTFNQACWARVDGSNLEVRTWTYGVLATGYLASRTGSQLTLSQQFSGAVDAEVVDGSSWPSSGYAPWFKVEDADPRTRSFVSRLDFTDGNGSIGEIVAVAKVVTSPIPSEVGQEYAYARLRIPLHVKHSREIFVNRLLFTH